jgi:hypothetical protein
MFTLDFAHLPSIPGMPTVPAAPTGFSDMSKTLMDKMTTDPGSLFSNPALNSVNLMGDTVTTVETKLRSIAGGEVNSGITASEASTYLAASGIQDLRTSLGNFMMHTNRLSGILKGQGISTPGLEHILSVGVQMQTMLTAINGASGCLAVLGGATGLFSNDLLDSSTSELAQVLDRINRGVATIADVSTKISTAIDLVRGIVDKDSQFLQNCVNQLQSAAVALAVGALSENPCAHFVYEQIANRNPGGVLDVLSNPILKRT